MAYLKNTLVSSSTYNSLPHIEDVSHVPGSEVHDLEILRALLAEHRVPDGVSIRLIHKHFDVDVGEAMIFKNIPIKEGYVQLMRPFETANIGSLQPLHYFVDDDGCLQAYEYTTDDLTLPDLSGYGAFLTEFCRVIRERGLQPKFGLKLRNDRDSAKVNWTEYELPQMRSTIMIPEGMECPSDDPLSYSVITEWTPDQKGAAYCNHSVRNCRHCVHCRHQSRSVDIPMDGSMYVVGGQIFLPETPVYHLMTAVVEAW